MRWMWSAGLFVPLVCCAPKPKAPSEQEARAAFDARRTKLQDIQDVLQKSINDAGLAKARPTCASSDDACLQGQRARDEKVAAARKNLERVVASSDVACAEITVSTPGFAEELGWRIAACPPGRRGDSVDPDKGAKVGDFSLGWGVYSKGDQVWRRGIALRRELKDGDAAAVIEIYYFMGD